MNPQDLRQTDSLSCIHAIEHFGLRRYTNPIDIIRYIKGLMKFVSLVSKGGRLYISFPIGQAGEVHFNAYRVFHVTSIFDRPSIKQHMKLRRFDYADDYGALHLDTSVTEVDKAVKYGCGIYTFEKSN